MPLASRRALLSLSVSLALVLLRASGARAQVIGGPLPQPLPLFPAANWWNIDISNAPVDANSQTYINFIKTTINESTEPHPDFGGEDSPGSVTIYGFPYITVSSSQPKVWVDFSNGYPDESDCAVSAPPYCYPVPSEAITQPHWIESGEPGNQDPGGDRHMLIVDTDNNVLYELYRLRYTSHWEADSGAIWDLTRNDRRPENWTSADAAGLAILPGLVRYDEVFPANGTDEIQHAFRVTVDSTNGHVYPASHTACGACPPNALPMGARLRLKATKDISGYPSEIQRIFRAFKKYGLVVADNGSDLYVSGAFNPNWDNGVLNPAFHSLTADDFEVVQLGYHPLDLKVTQLHSPDPPVINQPLQFQVTVANDDPDTQTGQATAHGVVVTDTLPANVTYDAGSSSTACSESAGVVTCIPGFGTATAGELEPQTSVTFLIVVTPQSGNTFENTATASGQEDDPVLANNTSVETAIIPIDASIGDALVAEGDSGSAPAVLTVTLSEAPSSDVTVSYATTDGSATLADGDYQAASGTLTFGAGETSRTLSVAVAGDTRDEYDESFSVTLTSAAGAAILDGVGTVSITDDDPPPTVSVGDASAAEGDLSFTTVSVPITLSAASGRTVSVAYQTGAGSATAGADFAAASGSVTFTPGTTSRLVAVRVLGDVALEGDETFSLSLSSPVNVDPGDMTGAITIQDDDATPALVPSDVTLAEGTGGTTDAAFVVTLSAPSGSPVSVDYATSDGTARAGRDYQARAGTLTFAPGQTTKTVLVPVIGDARRERNEGFVLQLANPGGARLPDASAQATILDDDGPPDACLPILTLPFTVSSPGCYGLGSSLATSLATGAAIEVAADDVRLELRGRSLTGSAGPATQAVGVFAEGRRNVTVENGTLRGFWLGVALLEPGPHTLPQGSRVLKVRAAGHTRGGLLLEGRGVRVAASQVLGSGGATSPDADAFGVSVRGPQPIVVGNLLAGFASAGGGSSTGLRLEACDGARVQRNRITSAGVADSVGVLAVGGSGLDVTGNSLAGLEAGIVFSAGASGSHAPNHYVGVATPYSGP